MSNNISTTGKCACGAVTYSIDGTPALMVQCHCKDCQRATGTGHISNAMFKDEDVKIMGDTTGFGSITGSGNTNTRHFCPTCGSRLFSRNTLRPGITAFAIGCADDHSWFTPQAIVFNCNAPEWDITDPDVTHFDRMPPPPKP